GYRERRRAIADWNQRNALVKRGLALTPVKFGISFTATHYNQAGALLQVYTDGTVLLNHGGTEMGQGLHIKVAQVVAAELGVPLAREAHAARSSLSATGYYRTPKIHWDKATLIGRPFFYFAYGAAVAEVALDTLSGETRLLRVDILHDVGASLNPAIDRGQVE